MKRPSILPRVPFATLCAAAFAAVTCSPPAHARVTRIVIDQTETLADGSGYERLRGRAFGELERAANGDPRPSLEERYGTQAGYACAVRKVAPARGRAAVPAEARC